MAELRSIMRPEQLLRNALKGEGELSQGQFMTARRASMPHRSMDVILKIMQVSEAEYLRYERDEALVPQDKKFVLKTALDCRGTEMEPLFDAVMGIARRPVIGNDPEYELSAALRKRHREGKLAYQPEGGDVAARLGENVHEWREIKQAFWERHPGKRIDLRGVDLSVGDKNYSGYDFDHCDLRGATLPSWERLFNISLKGARLVNGAHDRFNPDYMELPSALRIQYERNNKTKEQQIG